MTTPTTPTPVCVCGHDADSHDLDVEGCESLGRCRECLAIQP